MRESRETRESQNRIQTFARTYRVEATLTPSDSTSFEYGREADGTLAFFRSGISGTANPTCLRCDFFVMSTWAYG